MNNWRSNPILTRLAALLFLLLLAATACSGGESPTPLPTAAPTAASPTETPAPAESPTAALEVGSANVTGVVAEPPDGGQVAVTVQGEHPDGCTTVDQVATTYREGVFTIDLQTVRPADALCTQEIVPFSREVILDVTGLADGAYRVAANGVETTFQLVAATPTPMVVVPTVTISPTAGAPGSQVLLSVVDLPPASTVEIGLGRVNSEYDIIATAESDDAGLLELDLTLPGFVDEPGAWVFAVVTPAGNAYFSPTFTVTAEETGSVQVYLVALEDDGQSGPPVGCGDSLVPVDVVVAWETDPPLAASLAALLAYPDGEAGYNALAASELNVDAVEIDGGEAAVYLIGELRLGGACDAPRLAGQLQQTALQFDGVDGVTFFVNGTPLAELLDAQG